MAATLKSWPRAGTMLPKAILAVRDEGHVESHDTPLLQDRETVVGGLVPLGEHLATRVVASVCPDAVRESLPGNRCHGKGKRGRDEDR